MQAESKALQEAWSPDARVVGCCGHYKELVSFHPFNTDSNVEYYYRPFDKQWLDYDLSKVVRPREAIMKHMRKDNISLCLIKVNSSVDGLFKVLVTSGITDKTLLSSKDNTNVFPLYVYKENMGQEERIVNFKKELYDKIAKGLNYLPCYEDNVLVDPISDYNGVLYPMTMADWIAALDDQILRLRKTILEGDGTVSHQEAIEKAEREFEIYRKREMRMLESDFDKVVKQLKNMKYYTEEENV